MTRPLDFIESWDDAKNLFENFKMCISLLNFWLYQAQKMSKHMRGHSQISKNIFRTVLLVSFSQHL